jgi:hypothetical protein
MAPFVIPGIVLAIGFYAAYAPPPLALYGTATILVLAYTTRFLPIAYTSSAAAVRSINPEMEEAVRILGGGRLMAIRKVVAPLLKKSLAGAWILVFIPAARELSSAIFLVGPNTRVISVMLFDLSEEGNFEVLSALGLILLVVTLVIALVGFKIIGRTSCCGGVECRSWSCAGSSGASGRYGGCRDRPRPASGRVRLAARAVGLRQDDDAAHDRGLHRPTAGTIEMDGKVLSSPTGSLPPERRGMSMIFQSYAVWPNMTVAENVAFGLKLRKLSGDEVRRRVAEMLDIVQMGHLAGRYPAELSGGSSSAWRSPAPSSSSPSAAPRRAPVEPRRQPARGDALRDPAPARRVPHHHRLRHPRPGRGDGHLRPHRRDEPGADRAGRRAACPLHAAEDALRRGLHRPDELRRGHGGWVGHRLRPFRRPQGGRRGRRQACRQGSLLGQAAEPQPRARADERRPRRRGRGRRARLSRRVLGLRRRAGRRHHASQGDNPTACGA